MQFLHFCVRDLGNERPWNKLNNVLLQEKLNKFLFTIGWDEISSYTVYNDNVSFRIIDAKLKIGYWSY